MPVFDGGFAVVNALARSLGLESDASTSMRKVLDSTSVTRTSSQESDTTAVDTNEDVLVKACVDSKVGDGEDSEEMDLEDIDVGENAVAGTTEADKDAHDAEVDIAPGEAPSTNPPVSPLRVRRGLIEPLGIAAPATYADATNLATQFPDLKGEILALPLSPTRSPAIHTPGRPNWALAPDEPSTPPRNDVTNRGGHRKRGGRQGRGGNDTPARLDSRVCSPAHTPSMKQGRQSRSRTPSRSPKKSTGFVNPNGRHERIPSADIPIIAPSPTYICLPVGSSVVVTDSHQVQSGAGGMPNPADVDALIRELQNARGLGGAGSVTSTPSRGGTPNELSALTNTASGVTERGNILTQVPEMTPILPINRGRPLWIKDKGGVLRPDFRLGASEKPEKDDKNEVQMAGDREKADKDQNAMEVGKAEKDDKSVVQSSTPDTSSVTAPATASLPAPVASSMSAPACWSTPTRQVQATPSDRHCTPSPLRQTMLQRVNEILMARERTRSGSPLSSLAPSRVTSPVLASESKVTAAAPAIDGTATPLEKMKGRASPAVDGQAKTPLASPATAPKIETPHAREPARTVKFAPSVAMRPSHAARLSGPANVNTATPSAMRPPAASVIERPATVAAPDVFQLRGQARWPTLDEVLALQAKPASTDGL